jgi:DNA primase
VENQVEEIKKKLDIVDVIGRYLPLKKRGRHWLTNCPFHSEKTPSFTVSQELQIFKCFGCGKAGDIFNFLQEYDHIDFKEALEELAKIAGIVLKKDPQISQAESRRKRLIDLNYEAAKFYHYILTTHALGKPALDYVTKRGISTDTIRQFRIGFAPPNSQLIVNYLQKKGFMVPEMTATGTFGYSQYRRNQLYDRFQDRLVFPLADYRDRVLGFSGRILPTSANPKLAKYINSPETDIYHKSQMLFGLNFAKESIKQSNSVIVVEGEFDMISPFQLGVKNIVAIKGTAFTADQLQLLHRYTDTLILGLDADFAGNTAAKKSIELADNMEFDIQVLNLGDKYKDPDEAIRHDPNFFKVQLTNTLPVWDFIIASAFKNFDSGTVKGKKEILNMVLPFLVKINNSVIRNDYYNKLASQLGSALPSIQEEAAKHQTTQSAGTHTFTPPTANVTKTTKIDRLEEFLLTVILSAKKPVLLSKKINKKIDFTITRFKNIFLNLCSLDTEFDPSGFADSLSPELKPVFENIFLAATFLNLDSHHRAIEINKTVNQILDLELKEKLVKLSSQIAQAEAAGQTSLLEKLEQEYNHTLQQLSKIQATKS